MKYLCYYESKKSKTKKLWESSIHRYNNEQAYTIVLETPALGNTATGELLNIS